MQIGSLFSGIGGFDLAAQWMGWETRWYSEIDPYACRVMAKHFPRAYNVGDISTWEPMADARGARQGLLQDEGCVSTSEVGQTSDAESRSGDSVDLICGGFPCQPVSVAGKQLAQDDPRWLWPHFARIIRILRPRYIVVENVPGLLVRGMGDVLGDLSEIGYDAEWETISAAAVGAPHKRDRIWIVAYPQRQRRPTGAFHSGIFSETLPETPARKLGGGVRRQSWWDIEPDVGRVAHGVSARVDRLKCLGNAIVPQVAYWIFQQIEQCER